MKQLLVLTTTLLLSFSSFSQEDTTVIFQPLDSIIPIETISVLNIMDIGCAHGHICCYAHCGCCPELQRDQIYDTVFRVKTNGVLKAVVAERYEIANMHDYRPVHMRYLKNGVWSEKFYPLNVSTPWMRVVFTEYLSAKPKQRVKETQPYEKEEVLVFDSNGEYMVVDLEGKAVPMKFQAITVFTPELSIGSRVVDNNVVCALLKPDGTAISHTKYSAIYPFNEDGLAVVQSNRGTGLIDKYGNEVIPSTQSWLYRIGENRYKIETIDGAMICDGQGNRITKEGYKPIGNYSEGLVFASNGDKSFCYLDMDGNVVLTIDQEWGREFSGGLAAVLKDKKWGFIDRTGKLVIPYQYYNVREFHDGIAAVATGVMNNEMWILIDKTGKQVNKKSYSEIMAFKSGIAQMRINGVGYGFIDTKGNELMECKYTEMGYRAKDHWDVNGMFIRSTIKDRVLVEGSMEIVDIKGNKIAGLEPYIAAVFHQKDYRSPGFYSFVQVYKNDHSTNLVNFEGKTLFKTDYEQIHIYSNELAVGVKNGQYFILNPTTGELISNFGSKRIDNIQYGIVTVAVSSESYLYDHYDLNGRKIEE